MSRKVDRRWELTGTLIARSPVQLGSTAGADLNQARDGLNRPVLPGTALTGVIRAALPDELRDHALWGAAHGALAMTTPGDTSMATKTEILKLAAGGGARVDR